MTEEILSIKNLKISFKTYKGILKVIPGLDFHIKSGERIGLIGETGCGKTTLLKTVARLLPVPPGIVEKESLNLFGKPIDKKTGLKNVRSNVSMILQDPMLSLNPTLKVSTQMTDIYKSQFANLKKQEIRERMVTALKEVSMPDPGRVLDSYPVQLSGGMRQRVCIAMALIKDTKLLLADEPTTALDVTIEEQILDLLNKIIVDSDKSLILVSHALGTVRKITDRLNVMYAGTIVETGSTKEIFDSPAHPYTAGLIGATPKLTGAGLSDGIAGNLPDYLNLPRGCRFAERCPKREPICLKEAPVMRKISEDRSAACHLL